MTIQNNQCAYVITKYSINASNSVSNPPPGLRNYTSSLYQGNKGWFEILGVLIHHHHHHHHHHHRLHHKLNTPKWAWIFPSLLSDPSQSLANICQLGAPIFFTSSSSPHLHWSLDIPCRPYPGFIIVIIFAIYFSSISTWKISYISISLLDSQNFKYIKVVPNCNPILDSKKKAVVDYYHLPQHYTFLNPPLCIQYNNVFMRNEEVSTEFQPVCRNSDHPQVCTFQYICFSVNKTSNGYTLPELLSCKCWVEVCV